MAAVAFIGFDRSRSGMGWVGPALWVALVAVSEELPEVLRQLESPRLRRHLSHRRGVT